MNQNVNLDKSTGFAAEIQSQMEGRVGLNNRGVRQAGFLVLYKTTMPSVLVEAGYISNPEEEKFLMSSKGQDYIASAIFRAFKKIAGTNVTIEKPDTVRAAPEPKTTGVEKSGKLSFRVQIAADPVELGAESPKLEGFNDVKVYRHGGLYKYTVGNETNLEDARRLLVSIREKGVKDAFIVIFRNGERVSQAEADSIMRK
jgi:N-acetylmuramoyl-L-alanine amidase